MSQRILVADDAPAVRAMIEDALQRAGVDQRMIAFAEDGRDALETFSQEQPEVVFMDLGMPGMDGVDATEQILSTEPRTRVVAMTGLLPTDERVQAVTSLGAFEVLHKPVTAQDVEKALLRIREAEGGVGRIQ